MEVENSNNDGGLERADSSDDGQFQLALRKMTKKEFEVMVISTVHRVIVPVFDELTRKAIKEEIEKTLFTWNANVVTKRCLQLKLPDEVLEPVLTGELVYGKGGNLLKVELVDSETGQVVETGPVSCAQVEILVIDASGDGSEHFNNNIITEDDKERPHFSKKICINLEKGVGVLSNVKLGHNSTWKKSCRCRLGARIVGTFGGVDVQEGKTNSFMVKDKRGKQYVKSCIPRLSDQVWRLKNISRRGAWCKLLNDEKVETVEDFLFLLTVHSQRLQKLVGGGAKWKAMVDHAKTCPINDKVYLYYSSTEHKKGVVFDVVGGLKGIVNDTVYVPISNLSANEKDCAHELLLASFENRKDRILFDDEASVMKIFSYRWSDINDLSVSDYIVEHYPAETNTGQIYEHVMGDPGASSHAYGIQNIISQSEDLDWDSVERLFDVRARLLVFHVAKAKIWVLRAKKRVMLGPNHAHKKHKSQLVCM